MLPSLPLAFLRTTFVCPDFTATQFDPPVSYLNLQISAPALRITSRSALRFTRLLPFLPFGEKGMRGTRVSMLAALILANWSTAGMVMGGSGFPTPLMTIQIVRISLLKAFVSDTGITVSPAAFTFRRNLAATPPW